MTTFSDSLREAGTINPQGIENALRGVVNDHGLVWIDWLRDAVADGNSPYDADALADWLGY